MTPAEGRRDIFELTLTLPADVRLAGMVRDVVAHGARQAGCADAAAQAFGCRVEDAVRDIWADAGGEAPVSIVVQHLAGPMEVVIACSRGTRILALDL